MSAIQRVAWWCLVSLTTIGALFIWPQFSDAQNPFFIMPIIAEVVVGIVLTTRRPENPVGWVFLGVGAMSGLLIASVVLTTWAAGDGGAFPWWGTIAAWFAAWTWYPLLYLLTVPTLLLFPSGLLSPRWRAVLACSALASVGLALLAATGPELEVQFADDGTVTRTIANPASFADLGQFTSPEDHPLFKALAVVLLICLMAAIASVGIRFKRSGDVERLQLRWFGFAVFLFIPLIAAELAVGADTETPLWLMLLEAGVVAAIPVSCGVAILRYRLYDIDRIISRTTSYAIVTGTLVGCYALIVTLVSGLLPDSSTLAVAAATLAVAAAFRPLLRRVRTVVDRRFDREHYDAELAVGDFADRLRNANEVISVVDDLGAVVRRVFQPSGVGVWVRAAVERDGGRHGR